MLYKVFSKEKKRLCTHEPMKSYWMILIKVQEDRSFSEKKKSLNEANKVCISNI